MSISGRNSLLCFFCLLFCFWRLKLMEGSAKIISLIARDESQHLALTQKILYKWKKGDDPEMQQIARKKKKQCVRCFLTQCQEKNGQSICLRMVVMIGLNERLLSQYVEWVANRRMKPLDWHLPSTSLLRIILCHGQSIG